MKFDKQTKDSLFRLIEESISNDTLAIEKAIIEFSNSIKKKDSLFHQEIIRLLYSKNNNGNYLRSNKIDPLPIDLDSKLETAQIVQPVSNFSKPVLSISQESRIDDFLNEQLHIEKLISKNLVPSSKLLLIGPPGTGKTMLAKYISSKLMRELVILDLATVVSSFLGKTGLNLKKVLNYAKRNRVILLLDEFDAIAKRRDDPTDLGELKRVVNILLVELDSWPSNSILIATSNHPELLDKAVWRRFDETIQIDNPNESEIYRLLKLNLPIFKVSIFDIVTPFLVGRSASDICAYTNKVKRRMVMKKVDSLTASLFELGTFVDKNIKGSLCRKVKETLGSHVTVRDLAQILDLSPSGVQYHLSKQN